MMKGPVLLTLLCSCSLVVNAELQNETRAHTETKETFCRTEEGLSGLCTAKCPTCSECSDDCRPQPLEYTALSPFDTTSCGQGSRSCEEGGLAGFLFNKNKCNREDGSESSERSFPWIVGIYRSHPFLLWKRSSFRCIGIILHKKYVLTGAHCFHDSVDKGQYDVKVGLFGFNRNLPVMALKKISLNPAYVKGHFLHDLAVLEVVEKKRMVDVTPVCLPIDAPHGISLVEENYNSLIGWETKSKGISFERLVNSETPQELRLQIRPIQDCVRMYLKNKSNGLHVFPSLITDQHFICAKTMDSNQSCQAGTRGPLTVTSSDGDQRTVVVGILSAGSFECEGDQPTLYTRIAPYLNWIKHVTEL